MYYEKNDKIKVFVGEKGLNNIYYIRINYMNISCS